MRDGLARFARRPRNAARQAMKIPYVGAGGSRPWRVAVLTTIAITLAIPIPAGAHVGSPDVFLDAQAGPYRALVTVRPPQVIPGVAEVELRMTTPGIRQVRIAPTPLTGPA